MLKNYKVGFDLAGEFPTGAVTSAPNERWLKPSVILCRMCCGIWVDALLPHMIPQIPFLT